MDNLTKVELKKIAWTIGISTSLITTLLTLGSLKLFFFKKSKEERRVVVAGKDSPVIIRGGSITAIASGVWDLYKAPNVYSAPLSSAADKKTIVISGEGVPTSTSAMDYSWTISITARDSNGNVDPSGSNGFILCSNADCSTGKPIEATNLVYLTTIDPNDTIVRPDVDDDDGKEGPGGVIKYHRWGFNHSNNCQRCNHISEIWISQGVKVPHPCHNGRCEVGVGTPN